MTRKTYVSWTLSLLFAALVAGPRAARAEYADVPMSYSTLASIVVDEYRTHLGSSVTVSEINFWYAYAYAYYSGGYIAESVLRQAILDYYTPAIAKLGVPLWKVTTLSAGYAVDSYYLQATAPKNGKRLGSAFKGIVYGDLGPTVCDRPLYQVSCRRTGANGVTYVQKILSAVPKPQGCTAIAAPILGYACSLPLTGTKAIIPGKYIFQ